MALTTFNVTGRFHNQDGSPIEGVSITVELTDTDRTGSGTFAPERQTFETDENGLVVMPLVPNAAGLNGTKYIITAIHPETGKRIYNKKEFTVLSADAFLDTLFGDSPVATEAYINTALDTFQQYHADLLAIEPELSTVAGIAEDLTQVASLDAADLETVADNVDDIVTLAGISDDVSTLAAVASTIQDLALQHNLVGAGPPAATDDSDAGYKKGSKWYDVSSSPIEVYICVNAAVGAAQWELITLDAADLGTMAVQNSSNVDITGGAINGVSIGAVAPADATFTTVGASGVVTLANTTEATTTANGAVRIAGGLSVIKNAFIGGLVNIAGALVVAAAATFAAGAAATPSLTFSGATDKGLYDAGSNTVGIAARGAAALTVTSEASAVNYWQLRGTSTGQGVLLQAQGSDTNVGAIIASKGSSEVFLVTSRDTGWHPQLTATHVNNSVNYISIAGAVTTGAPVVAAVGADTNINLRFVTKGTGALRFITGGGSYEQFMVTHTANAMNYMQVTGGATGVGPILYFTGADTNVEANLWAKGTGGFNFATNAGTLQFRVNHSPSAVNYVAVTGAVTTGNPLVYAQGSDAAIGMTYQTKGGAVHAFTTTGGTSAAMLWVYGATSGNEGGELVLLGSTGFDATRLDNFAGYARLFNTAGDDHRYQYEFRGDVFSVGLGGAAGTASTQFTVSHTASAVNYLNVTGGSTGNRISLSATGTDAGIGINYVAKGNGAHVFTGQNSAIQFVITSTASSANYIQATAATAGSLPGFYAEGSDANVSIGHRTKGNGAHIFYGHTGASINFIVSSSASAVNYLQVVGAATGLKPSFMAQGSDANVSISYVTKGTGSHDFVTNGAVQFVISNTTSAVNYWQLTGGSTGTSVSAYAAGSDTNAGMYFITKGTGTFNVATAGTTSNIQLRVAHVASAVNFIQVAGAATGSNVTVSAEGSDTNIPFAVSAKGSGQVMLGNTNHTAAFGVELGQGATADRSCYIDFHSDTTNVDYSYRLLRNGGANASISYINAGTGAHSFQTNAGTNTQFVVYHTASSVNYARVTGGITGANPILSVEGADTNINLSITGKGTGGVAIYSNTTAALQLYVTHTASAVNYVQATGGATGNRVSLSAQGSDTDISLGLSSKGGSNVVLWGNNFGQVLFSANYAPSAVNYLGVTSSAAGVAPSLAAVGADAHIDVALIPKGANGRVKFGVVTPSGDVAISGYLEMKAANGDTIKLALVA